MSVISVIKGCPLFHEFYDEEIERIIEQCEVAQYAEGEYIFHDGDSGNDVVILLSGKAHVLKGSRVLAEISKGDMLGELALINQGGRNADVVAVAPTDILMIRYDFIYDLFHQDPKVFSLFFVNLSRILARRLIMAGTDLRDTYTRIKQLEEGVDIRKKAA